MKLHRTGGIVALALALMTAGRADAGSSTFALEFEHSFGSTPLRLGERNLKSEAGNHLSITRLDYLLSGLAFQETESGKWMEVPRWYASISVSGGRTGAVVGQLPPRKFKAVRLTVGVDPAANRADPNAIPVGHPLHPEVNHLHWGWQGGYVFLAVEGQLAPGSRPASDASIDGGYSYHLANDGNQVLLEIPVAIDTSKDRTLVLNVDARTLFGSGKTKIDLAKDKTSTHSRSHDPLVTRLRSNVGDAFSFSRISRDSFRMAESKPGAGEFAASVVGTPYRHQISRRLPLAPMPADNPLTEEGVQLGEALFFEPRISRDNSLSCASCHDRARAFSDSPHRVSSGVGGKKGKRNSMPLFNLAWADSFFWDGRAGTLREQVLMPIQDHHEMNESLERVVRKLQLSSEPGEGESYRSMFRLAFGDSAITSDRIARALEQYLLTLISQDSKFDRAARGEVKFTKEEQRGLQLFVTEYDPALNLRGADCFHCHGGNLFSSHQFANNGLDRSFVDPGRYVVTGKEEDRGKFKTPSLRNVALTGPYMHDGRFETLEEVVEHYNRGVLASPTLDPNLAKHPKGGLALSEADRKALVAFLHTLTDEKFATAKASKVTASRRRQATLAPRG